MGKKKKGIFFFFPEAQVHSTKGRLPTLSTVTMQSRTQSGEDLSGCSGLPHPGDWRAQVVVDSKISDTWEAEGSRERERETLAICGLWW